jgi:hypothetical protein
MPIPPKIKRFLDIWFRPATENSASDDILIATLLMQVARFGCWCRITVGRENTIPSMLIFNFAPSGSYKDRPKAKQAKLISPILEKQKALKQEVYDRWAEENERLMDTMSNADKQRHKKNYKVKRFHNSMDEGTVQGYQSDRKACYEAGIGHVHYEHEELAGYITSKDGNFFDLMTMLIKGWDLGNTKSRVIQTEYRGHVEGVPITAFAHSSISRLLENPRAFANLKALFESGLSRKSFILYQHNHKRREITEDEQDVYELLEDAGRDEACAMMDSVFEAVRPSYNRNSKTWNAVHIDDVLIKKQINKYKNQCYELSSKTKEIILQPEIRDRWLKAYRLAAFIALFEHPDELTIKPEDYEWAISLAEKWGRQYAELISQEGKDPITSIADSMRDGKELSLTEIRIKLKAGNNTYVLKSALERLQENANETGERMIERKGRGMARYYRFEKMPDHGLMEKNKTIVFSVSQSAKETDTLFEKDIIAWEDFWQVPIEGKVCWSPNYFYNNIRGMENVKDGSDMIVFDIDNECEKKYQFTVEMAEAALSGFETLIVTTRHHQKTKKEWPENDRFRIILPVKLPLPAFEEIDRYKNIYKATAEYFGLMDIVGWTDMKSSADMARLYYPNKGIYKYIKGKLADWRVFEENKIINTEPADGKWKDEELPLNQTITLSRGHIIDKKDAIIIARGKGHKTTPCYAFCHEDKNPSAFFCISKKSDNRWMYFCSKCGKKYF